MYYSSSTWFFSIWVMFWNRSWIYFSFLSIKSINNNCYIIFPKCFPIIFFWWEIYPFQFIFIYKRFILWGSCFIFSWYNTTVTTYLKHLLLFYLYRNISILYRIYICFFVFHPINRISLWSTTIQINFMAFMV